MVEWVELFSNVNWVGFIIAFGLFVITPVWFMDIVGDGLSFSYKIMFTFGGGAAAFLAVQKKSNRGNY